MVERISLSLDLILFFLLLALLIYLFVSATITNLLKIYMVFHFSMMLWPLCQFLIERTQNIQLQELYVKIAFVDLSLLAVGWILFTILLTGKYNYLQIKTIILLIMPAIVAAVCVIVNPNELFVAPLNGGYIYKVYGPLFWFAIAILLSYLVISRFFMYQVLVSDSSIRIKKQVKRVFSGILVVVFFSILDIFLNVVTVKWMQIVPGLTSLGILLSAIIFVIAIHRDKVLDIVTVAQQDIIDTISMGIVVLDENNDVVKLNKPMQTYVNLHIGEYFDLEALILSCNTNLRADPFLLNEYPLQKREFQVTCPEQRRVTIQTAPIVIRDKMVGRLITFQDVSELHDLINEKNIQNEILKERNQSLILMRDELFQTNRKLEELAVTDVLTGCYNRRYLTQLLENEVIPYIKHQTPFAILLMDIDNFKNVNDHYGHLAGDEVICSTAEVIKETLRQNDILARFGGEEFIIYLPQTNRFDASIVADKVKSAVESNKVLIEAGAHSLSVTISIGLLSIEHVNEYFNEPKMYLKQMLSYVDEALYQAKKEGRNRISPATYL